jgi:hypothetical protein
MSRAPSPTISELEALLTELIAEHQRLLKNLAAHQAAMRLFDLKQMDALAKAQEASRARIVTLELKRRAVVLTLGRAHGLGTSPTMADLARLHPQRSAALLRQRDALKELVAQVSSRARVCGKLAGAVLGHLNTVVRLLAGAVEKAGLYTKHGVPQVSTRIGVMEAIG